MVFSHKDGLWGGQKWYFKRYIRILVPYLVIQSIIGLIICLLNNESIWFFLSYVSTLEFWLSHRGAWFIALILPLYLMAPVLYKWLNDKGFLKVFFITIICYMIALFPNSSTEWTICKNIQYAIIRVPVFVLGMYMAPQICNGEKISKRVVCFLLVIALLMLVLTRKPVNSYLFIVIPLVLLLSKSFSSERGLYNRICRFFGNISLESYLWNAIGPFILLIMGFYHIPDYNNLLMYSMVIVIGTILASYTHKITTPIISYMNKKIC